MRKYLCFFILSIIFAICGITYLVIVRGLSFLDVILIILSILIFIFLLIGMYRKMDNNGLIGTQRLLRRGPKLVVIGGGTGLSTLLRGLKNFTTNITAVVTVADDGGSSGWIREDLGILPPGDIRNCILALSHTEPIMEKLLQYRFAEGSLKGQSFGNLFIAAMNGISENFKEAIKKISDVLAVTGQVLPVTLENIRLCAELEDGTVICGESLIPVKQQELGVPIKRVFLEPEEVEPLDEVITAILEADAVVLGPGSLYTSILPNLLVKGVSDAINLSNAVKIYVSNIMTQPGETTGYSVSDHVRALVENGKIKKIDYVIVNNGKIPENFLKRYENEGAFPVEKDYSFLKGFGTYVIEDDFVSIKYDYLRHNEIKLALKIIEVIIKRQLNIFKMRSR